MMKNVRGIIFDCDGVLFESRKANLAYYNAVLKHFDEQSVDESDHEKAHLCHTAASTHVFKKLLGDQRATQALTLAAELDYRQFIPYMQPEPGMKEALAQLSASYPLAVATNRGYSMPEILKHFELNDYFQVVVTSRDVERPKPAPDMLHEVARQLNYSEDELLFVGDSELDQAAARAAGMLFAVYKGDHQADVKLDHHRELLQILHHL
jgi:HAD superfamily hydrolase (TIGR01509 family)